MKDNKEIRFAANEVQVRAAGEATGKGNTLTGYAIKFNDATTIGGQFEERVSTTALDGVDTSGTFALYNHDWNAPLGKSGKNLRLSQDATGLRVDLDLPNTSVANDLAELVRTGVVEGMSFGFTVAEDTWEQRDGLPLRTIDKIGELFEVTFTPIPAYPTTEVGLRSMESQLTSEEMAEIMPETEVRDWTLEEAASQFEAIAEELGTDVARVVSAAAKKSPAPTPSEEDGNEEKDSGKLDTE